jgi:hypothetical protein
MRRDVTKQVLIRLDRIETKPDAVSERRVNSLYRLGAKVDGVAQSLAPRIAGVSAKLDEFRAATEYHYGHLQHSSMLCERR